MKSLRGIVVGTALLCLLLACGRAEDAPADTTVTDSEVPALTREQIQQSAEAMSPEVAESLGIVDTTIRIESPMPPESLRPPLFNPDSAPSR